MSKHELELMKKIVTACQSSLMAMAGQMPVLQDVCFDQVKDLGEAIQSVIDEQGKE